MNRRRSALSAVLAGTIVAVGLAACGDDDTSTPTPEATAPVVIAPPASTPTPAPTAPDEPTATTGTPVPPPAGVGE